MAKVLEVDFNTKASRVIDKNIPLANPDVIVPKDKVNDLKSLLVSKGLISKEEADSL